MNESRALAVLVDVLEIDHELRRVVLSEGKDLGSVEGDYVVCDHVGRLGHEVGVIDAEMRVEPVNLIRNEFARNETLDRQDPREYTTETRQFPRSHERYLSTNDTDLFGNVRLNLRTLLLLTLENGRRITRHVLHAVQRGLSGYSQKVLGLSVGRCSARSARARRLQRCRHCGGRSRVRIR